MKTPHWTTTPLIIDINYIVYLYIFNIFIFHIYKTPHWTTAALIILTTDLYKIMQCILGALLYLVQCIILWKGWLAIAKLKPLSLFITLKSYESIWHWHLTFVKRLLIGRPRRCSYLVLICIMQCILIAMHHLLNYYIQHSFTFESF